MSVVPNLIVDITPQQQQLIMGLIPCQNRYFQDLVWPVIRPGVVELASASEGEWTEFRAWREVYAGSFQLYICYMNKSAEQLKEGINQEAFVNKLKTPADGYAGFFALQLQDVGVHIFCAYIAPEYRKTNVASMALEFLEQQVKAMGAPYISGCAIPELLEAAKKRGYVPTVMSFRKKL